MIETNALGPSARGSGRRSNFSISGKLMSTCGRPVGALGGDQFGQAVQGLRTEHQVDVRRALDDRRALLRGHAAADADHHRAVALLERLPAAELAEHLFLRLLADRAGVDQDDVGFFDLVGQLQAVAGGEHVGHLGRVVLVHLAAVGLDEELFRRGRGGRGACRSWLDPGWAAVIPRRRGRHSTGGGPGWAGSRGPDRGLLMCRAEGARPAPTGAPGCPSTLPRPCSGSFACWWLRRPGPTAARCRPGQPSVDAPGPDRGRRRRSPASAPPGPVDAPVVTHGRHRPDAGRPRRDLQLRPRWRGPLQ